MRWILILLIVIVHIQASAGQTCPEKPKVPSKIDTPNLDGTLRRMLTDNLIPNPSFEKVRIIDRKWCGNHSSFDDKMHEWTSPTLTSPDLLFDKYLNQMEPERDNVDFGECRPRTGRLMVGIKTYGCINRVYHCKEYIQVKLKENIEQGRCYKYGFWVSTIHSSMRSNNLGIALSDTLVAQYNNGGLLDLDHKYGEGRLVGDEPGKWYKIEGEFVPKRTFQYFIIGNFSSDLKTLTHSPKDALDYSYYMIDDVFLHEIECPRGDTNQLASLVLSDIMFEFDNWKVNEQGQKQIGQFVMHLDLAKIKEVLIIGHTDEIGRDTYNFALSEKRAESVKEVFIEYGISHGKIRTMGLGSSKLVDEGSSAKNRRVEITVK